jgi:hypothetical protein
MAAARNDRKLITVMAACLVAYLVIALLMFGFPLALSQRDQLSHDSGAGSGLLATPINAKQDPSETSFWYVGTSSNDSAGLSNEGIRATIQVMNQNVSGVLSFWVSETFKNDLWAQVGYYIENRTSPVAFCQIWNLTNNSEVWSNATEVGEGMHTFEISYLKGTNWSFLLDGTQFALFDMHTNETSHTSPVHAMSEEGYVSEQFSFSPVEFSSLQLFFFGSWHNIAEATSIGNAWGMQGRMQNSSFAPNEFAVGGDSAPLPSDSALWSYSD